MSIVHLDSLTTLEANERYGTLQRITRLAVVTGLVDTDWESLKTALDAVGVPDYGDRLSTSSSNPGYELICVERSPRMVDKGTCHVELLYENAFNIDQIEDSIDTPYFGSLGGEVRCNVQQKTSNLDINGDQVTVTHTYPDDDPNHPGETLTQGGEFQYYDAQRSFRIHGIKVTNTPWLIANYIVGCVNSIEFSGETYRTWLCVACNWKPQGYHAGNQAYYMGFEFQFDADTWDPTVVFIDDVTGKPPADLVPDEGIVTVEKLPSCDFEQVIGTWIQGG